MSAFAPDPSLASDSSGVGGAGARGVSTWPGRLGALAPAGLSPAPLRLRLDVGAAGDALMVDILKRRGSPLAAPLRLPAQPPVVRALLAAGAARGRTRQARRDAQVLPFGARSGGAQPGGATLCEVVHAVDRVAVAA